VDIPSLVMWDLGGVLVSYDADSQIKEMALLFGQPIARIKEALRGQGGQGLLTRFECGRISAEDYASSLEQRFGRAVARDQFWDAHNSSIWPNARAIELLKMVKARRPAVKHATVSDIDSRRLDHALRIVNFRFTVTLASFMVKNLKPGTDIYLKAMTLTGTLPVQCAYFDDQDPNIQAARTLGIRGFRYKDDKQFESDLRALGLL
jgi:beta-phosphoglucomutase-like phosphatase (HAD superfamily)